MFTGLVQSKGVLVRRTQHGRDARLVVRGTLVSSNAAGTDHIELGESIAIDGVCLTVDKIVEAGSSSTETVFEADASSETLEKTTLGSLPIGAPVNLERALPIGGRLGGHIVSGHVDGVGKIVEKTSVGGALKVVFEVPRDLARYVAPKGSICVSGVSLTVNNVSDEGSTKFDVMLIPHTRDKTSLDGLGVGDPVNLEVDVLARYVARLMSAPGSASVSSHTDSAATDDVLLERLRSAGYM